jgi:hypothetical protein
MDGYQAKVPRRCDTRNAIHIKDVTMAKDRIEDSAPIEIEDGCIDDVDRSLNPYGRFLRHNHMHQDHMHQRVVR